MDEAFNVLRVLEKSAYDYIKQKTLEKTGESEYDDALLFDLFIKACGK